MGILITQFHNKILQCQSGTGSLNVVGHGTKLEN